MFSQEQIYWFSIAFVLGIIMVFIAICLVSLPFRRMQFEPHYDEDAWMERHDSVHYTDTSEDEDMRERDWL